jgi:hypothetical protein
MPNYTNDPKTRHMLALKRIIRYIHDTIDYSFHLYPSLIYQQIGFLHYCRLGWLLRQHASHFWLMCLSL